MPLEGSRKLLSFWVLRIPFIKENVKHLQKCETFTDWKSKKKKKKKTYQQI